MKLPKMFLAVSVLVVFALSPACGQARPGPGPDSSESYQQPVGQPGESRVSEWDRMLAVAREERQVVIYTTRGSEARAAIARAFNNRHGLDIEWVTGKGAELAEKLLKERSAGLYFADVYMAGPTTILFTLIPQGAVAPMRPVLALPEVTDPKVWYGDRLPFLDKEDRRVMGFVGYVFRPLAINTSLVKADEMTSYNDLLNPRWRDRIAMLDPTIPGTAASFFTAVGQYIMGYDFMRELAKQKPFIHRDDRLLTEWVAREKYAMVIGAKPDPIGEFIKAGATIRSVIPREGSYLEPGAGTFALVDRPAHPNAARVFVNWLLTKEGQTVYSRAVGVESAREDVPKDHLDPGLLREPGKKYVFGREDFHTIADENIRTGKAKEIFQGLLGK